MDNVNESQPLARPQVLPLKDGLSQNQRAAEIAEHADIIRILVGIARSAGPDRVDATLRAIWSSADAVYRYTSSK